MISWQYALAGALVVFAAALAFLAVALSARDRPAIPVSEAYGDLLESRAVRGDLRVEPTPPPVAVPPDSGATATAAPNGGTATPEAASATPAPAVYVAPVERLRIPRIDVDAPLINLNINARGEMEVPNDPELVAWYDFTGKPGLGGNAVFSGHVDWVNYGPAVFWDLGKLERGDEVEVVLRDGTVLTYAVTASAAYPVEELDMREVLAPTAQESVTLITCTGQFTAGSYTDRLVIRAVLTGVATP